MRDNTHTIPPTARLVAAVHVQQSSLVPRTRFARPLHHQTTTFEWRRMRKVPPRLATHSAAIMSRIAEILIHSLARLNRNCWLRPSAKSSGTTLRTTRNIRGNDEEDTTVCHLLLIEWNRERTCRAWMVFECGGELWKRSSLEFR